MVVEERGTFRLSDELRDLVDVDWPKMGPFTSEARRQNDAFYNPHLSEEELDLREEERRKDFRVGLAGIGKGYDKRMMRFGNPLQRLYYSIKHGLLNSFSEDYRDARSVL